MIAVLLFQIVTLPYQASAAQIVDRSLTLLTGSGGDGGSLPGGTVNHQFDFTVPSTGATNIGSIRFEYCTTAAGACTIPTGLDTTSAALGTESGATGFTVNNTTNGVPYLTRSAAAVAANTTLSYRLNNIVNPELGPAVPDTNYTFFVRITTFDAANLTGTEVDYGVVTASTAEPIILSGVMPESLIFCTGEEIFTTVGVPDCATATDGTIVFDQLFSPTDTATSRSQMAASTNAGFGYTITVNGPTLTSGANTIAGMGVRGLGVRGTAQFGLNLVENTVLTSTVAVGAPVAPAPNGTNYRGQPATDYDTVDEFKFVSGDIVANSFNGVPGATDAQIYTVSYIANVPGSQAAGTYTTTLTYVCTPTF